MKKPKWAEEYEYPVPERKELSPEEKKKAIEELNSLRRSLGLPIEDSNGD